MRGSTQQVMGTPWQAPCHQALVWTKFPEARHELVSLFERDVHWSVGVREGLRPMMHLPMFFSGFCFLFLTMLTAPQNRMTQSRQANDVPCTTSKRTVSDKLESGFVAGYSPT